MLMAVPVLPGIGAGEQQRALFAVWFLPSSEKVHPDDIPVSSSAVWDASGIHLTAARGEHEAFQAVVIVDADACATIALSPLIGPSSGPSPTPEYFQVRYPSNTDWPDPLVPVASSAYLTGTKNNPLLVDISVPRDALPGKYCANLTIGTGIETSTTPLTVNVWNITLPETPTLRTWFDDSSSSWASYYRYPPWSTEHQALMKNVYQQYKKFKISPGNIDLGLVGRYNMTVNNGVVSVDFSGTDPWLEYCLDTLGFTSFRFPLTGYSPRREDMAPSTGHPDGMYYWGAPPYDMNPTYADHIGQYIKLVADHYRQKGWLDRSYVYVTDEPIAFNDDVTSYWQHPDYHVVQQFYDLTKTNAPDLKFANTVQLVPELFDYTDVWAVPGGSYHELDALARIAADQSVWWYNVDAGIASPGTEGRALYWDTFSRGVQGVLYWGTNYWDYGTVNGDPWQGSTSNGDGYLFYPGNTAGIMDDVVPSLRLFLARDGIEDYELLHQYSELYGIEAARAVAESVAVGSAFAGARFQPINASLIYDVREWLADQITRQPYARTWTDTFRNTANVSSYTNLRVDQDWDGSLSLAPAYASVLADSVDSSLAWRPNNQPHIFSSVTADQAVRTEGLGSLRMEFWRDDDPGELGGYDHMRNGRVITNNVPLRDWSGYDILEMDIRSVQHPPGNLVMLVGDSSGTVVGSTLHQYARYRGGPDQNWTHVTIDISDRGRSDIQYIEPIVYNYFLEVPYQHYAYWLDNITVRRAGFQQAGSLTSKVIDLGVPVDAVRMAYLTQWELPAATALSFSTRSSDDNVTWSGWAPASQSSRLLLGVQSPKGRYYQYRVNFTSDGAGTPVLSEVRLEYQPLTSTDLSIGNISFDPAIPNENETFNISVPVHNLGRLDVAGAYVRFTMQNGPSPRPFANLTVNLSAGANTTLRFGCEGQPIYHVFIPISGTIEPPPGINDTDPANNRAFAELTINDYPRPNISAPAMAFVGELVVFNASSSTDEEGIAEFRWGFSDLNLTGAEVRRSFNVSGIWDYTLTARDLYGAEAAISSTIEIIDHIPVPDFVVNPDSGSVLTRFVFISTAYDPDDQIANHSWSFGDGTWAFGKVVNHQFQDHLAYMVNYTITYYENGTIHNATASRTVAVIDLPPVANFTMSASAVNKRKLVEFDGAASSDPDDTLGDRDFNWSFGDGAFSLGILVAHAYTATGYFNVTLTVTDPEGAQGSMTAQLKVLNLPPVPSFSAPANVTVNETFTLDASASRDPDGSIVGYRWEFDDGMVSNGASVVHSFSQTGVHRVVLVVTDNDGEGASAEATVRVDPAPPPHRRAQPGTGGTDTGLLAATGALLVILMAAITVLALRRRKAGAPDAGPPPGQLAAPLSEEERPPPPTGPVMPYPATEPAEAPASPTAEIAPPASEGPSLLSLPVLEAVPEAEGPPPPISHQAVSVPAGPPHPASTIEMGPPSEARGVPRVIGKARAPPPKVVKSYEPLAPREYHARPQDEVRAAGLLLPKGGASVAPPAKDDIPTISLDEAVAKRIELPAPARSMLERTSTVPPAGTEASRAAKAMEPTEADREADPTLPYNPWEARKR